MKRIIAGAILVAAVGYAGTKLYVQHRTSKAVDQFVALASAYVDIDYREVSTTMAGALSVDGILVDMPEYRDSLEIGSIGLKVPTFLDLLSLHEIQIGRRGGGLPDELSFFIRDVKIDSRMDFMREMFREGQLEVAEAHGGQVPTREEDPLGHCVFDYGLSTLDLLELDAEQTAISSEFGLRQLAGEVALDFDLDYEGLYAISSTFRFQGTIAAMSRGRVQRPVLMGFEVRLEDQSLGDKIYRRCEQLGIERAVAKSATIESFVADLVESGFVPDERLLEPLRAGVEAEHRYWTITGNPPSPVDLNRVGLYKAEDLPALLGIDLQSR